MGSNSILPPFLLLQNGYSRATAFGTRVFLQGLTVAVYSSLFDRSKSKRMDPSQGEESKRKTHIYIYTHQERASIRGGSHVPVQIVTSLTVTSVTDYRYGSPLPLSLSLSSASRTSPIRISLRSLFFGSVSQMTCRSRIMGYVRGINYTIHG